MVPAALQDGLQSEAVVWACLAVIFLLLAIWSVRRPHPSTNAKWPSMRDEVTKTISTDTVSTSTGSDSPCSSSSDQDFFAPCMGGVTSDAPRPAVSTRGWNAEYKFGLSRSKLYSTTFTPVKEDMGRLIQVAIPDPAKHEEVSSKLCRLRQLAEGLPGSGWVQPQDVRVLLRFLMARQLNVEKALEMLQNVLTWRQQNGVSNTLPMWDKALHERFDRYFKCIAFTGNDLDGDPVIVERCGKVHAASLGKCSEEFLKRHVIYTAECVLASMERNRQEHLKNGSLRGFQFTVVIDLEGIDMSFADRRLIALSKALGRIEADNYPEVLKRVIVCRAPWFFPAFFQMIRPFMDPGTVAKILVPKPGRETRETLLRHVHANAVPEELGGCLQNDVQLIPPGGVVPQELIDRTFHK